MTREFETDIDFTNTTDADRTRVNLGVDDYVTQAVAAVTGQNLPQGGNTDDVLAKQSNTDYDTVWVSPPEIVAGAGIDVSTAGPLTVISSLNAETRSTFNAASYLNNLAPFPMTTAMKYLVNTGDITAAGTSWVQLPAANSVPAGTEYTIVDGSGTCGPTHTIVILGNTALGDAIVNGFYGFVAIAIPYGGLTLRSDGVGGNTSGWQSVAASATSVSPSIGTVDIFGQYGAFYRNLASEKAVATHVNNVVPWACSSYGTANHWAVPDAARTIIMTGTPPSGGAYADLPLAKHVAPGYMIWFAPSAAVTPALPLIIYRNDPANGTDTIGALNIPLAVSTGGAMALVSNGSNHWDVIGFPATDDASFSSVTVGGLTGATSASRYVGATASGVPASGTFAVGDWGIEQTGKIFICTTAGVAGSGARFFEISGTLV